MEISIYRKSLTAVAVSVTAVLLWALSVSAETMGGNVPGRANADAGWKWKHSSIRDVYIGVDDLLCDAEGAYAYLRVYQPFTDKGYIDVARVEDACGRGPTYKQRLNFDGNSYISGVRPVVCVDSFGPDTCDRDNFVRNPTPK